MAGHPVHRPAPGVIPLRRVPLGVAFLRPRHHLIPPRVRQDQFLSRPVGQGVDLAQRPVMTADQLEIHRV